MLTVYVDTDVKMPKKMLEALTLFEAIAIFSEKTQTTEVEVRDFLANIYSQKLADSFIPSYLFSIPISSANLQ